MKERKRKLKTIAVPIFNVFHLRVMNHLEPD